MNIQELELYLIQNIPNKEILSMLFSDLNYYFGKQTLNVSIDEEKIIGSIKTNEKEFFDIKLMPGELDFLISKLNGNSQYHLTIKYDNCKTIVTIKELSQYVYPDGRFSSTDIRTNNKIYHNYELVYENEIYQETNSNLDAENVFRYTETNRIDKKRAIVHNTSLIGDKLVASYGMTNDYEGLYFDSSKNREIYHISKYYKISEDEYDEILNSKQKTITKLM